MQKRFKILVVDDEPINLQMVNSALQSDYEMSLARSGYEAIALLKEVNPDLVLLDVMMPDLNGFDVCRMLKAEPSFANTPVIFLTAMTSQEGEAEGLEAGGIDYLAKPINFALLKLRVRNHLELKNQRDLLVKQKAELEQALAQIKTLEGILPICMYCKSIRNDQDAWLRMEEYMEEHSDARFSHGICPDCLEKHYPDRKFDR